MQVAKKIDSTRGHFFLNSQILCTGISFPEAFILALTNPKYDKRLLIELRVQYIKTTSPEHVVYINCSELSIQKQKTICIHNMFLACSLDVLNS